MLTLLFFYKRLYFLTLDAPEYRALPAASPSRELLPFYPVSVMEIHGEDDDIVRFGEHRMYHQGWERPWKALSARRNLQR